MKMKPKNELPPTFRSEVVEPILQEAVAGNSCSVVGIGSVGKSNLLRFLQRKDVHQAYVDQALEKYLFVYVDINKILKNSVWGLLELMLHQLLMELTNNGFDETTLHKVEALHQKATSPKTRGLVLRYLDRALRIACNQLGLSIVFMFDEFDDLCRTMAPRGFAALRALRDDYKYRMMYVVATRLALRRLREKTLEMEPFEELVSPRTIWLGPYTEADARYMLQRLEARHQLPLDKDIIKEILDATGGHSGLLREGYRIAREHPKDFFKVLTRSPEVQDECQRIWLSLSASEQQAMESLVDDVNIATQQAQTVAQLRRKGLVGGPWRKDVQIFSSLFAEYITGQHPVVGAHIHVDHKRLLVSVKGHEIRDLTRLEYNLMAFLDEHRNRVCSRDELADHLYPEDSAFDGSGVADTRLDSLVKRLRRKVEPNPKEPRYIVTARGQGFRLIDGDGSGADR